MGDTSDNHSTPASLKQHHTKSDPFAFTPRSLTPSWHPTTPSHATASHFYVENQMGDPQYNPFLDCSEQSDHLASSGSSSKSDAIKVWPSSFVKKHLLTCVGPASYAAQKAMAVWFFQPGRHAIGPKANQVGTQAQIQLSTNRIPSWRNGVEFDSARISTPSNFRGANDGNGLAELGGNSGNAEGGFVLHRGLSPPISHSPKCVRTHARYAFATQHLEPR